MIFVYLLVSFVFSMIGLVIERQLLLKFFLCYESLFFFISVIILLFSCEINVIIMVLFILCSFYWYSWIPYPLYCGSILSNLVWDNGNIGFVLLILILFPLIDWIAGFESKTLNFSFLFILLLIGIFFCFLLLSLLLFFICYALLIVLLFFILFLFIPSYYRIRTSFFLFLFSIFGTISFIVSLLMYILSEWLLCFLLIIAPFYIKIPCFPSFYWLPEVHCEANSSISLFLAGLLLKLGLFGMLRFILCSFFLVLGFLCSFVISFSVISLIIVSRSCFRYFDLKKIIAFTPILHLNLTLVPIYSLSSIGLLCGILTSISHGFSSVSSFLFGGVLINKTYSRYFDSLFYIDSIFRGLFLFFLLANPSFPGSFNSLGEILALISINFIDIFFCFSFLISGLFSFLYFYLILNRKLPYQSCYSCSNYIEFFLFSQLICLVFFIGFSFLCDWNY